LHFINQHGLLSITKLIEKFQNSNIVDMLAKAIKELLNCEVDMVIEHLKENHNLITKF